MHGGTELMGHVDVFELSGADDFEECALFVGGGEGGEEHDDDHG